MRCNRIGNSCSGCGMLIITRLFVCSSFCLDVISYSVRENSIIGFICSIMRAVHVTRFTLDNAKRASRRRRLETWLSSKLVICVMQLNSFTIFLSPFSSLMPLLITIPVEGCWLVLSKLVALLFQPLCAFLSVSLPTLPSSNGEKSKHGRP